MTHTPPWQDPDSPWKTEAAFRSWLRGGFRRIWSKYPLKIKFIHNNRFKAPIGQKGKEVWAGVCAQCNKTTRTGQLQVDHIHPNPPLADGVEEYLKSLFPTQEGMQFLCHPCHKAVTYAEKNNISLEEAKRAKKVIAIMKLPADKQIMWMKAQKIDTPEAIKNSKTRKAAITKYHN